MIGHLSIETSSTIRYYVEHGGSIIVKGRNAKYRPSHLEQGGLEVPVTIMC